MDVAVTVMSMEPSVSASKLAPVRDSDHAVLVDGKAAVVDGVETTVRGIGVGGQLAVTPTWVPAVAFFGDRVVRGIRVGDGGNVILVDVATRRW